MTSVAKITTDNLSNYTIYFLILQDLNCVLYDGRKLKLSNPEDYDFTAKFGHERIDFKQINYIEYELSIIDENNELLDSDRWWEMLTDRQKRNLREFYCPAVISEETSSLVKTIYRQLIIDQYSKGVVKIPSLEKYLDWWILLPWGNQEIFLKKLPKIHLFNYSFDNIITLYDTLIKDFNEELIKVLQWWRKLSPSEQKNIIIKYDEFKMHFSSVTIDKIKKYFLDEHS
jgi:hypothetical protein